MSGYIHGNGTFDLKIHAVVVWGGVNLYNLDEMEREMIFCKTIKKKFPTYSVLEKSTYHLIVAISVELHTHARMHIHIYINKYIKKYINIADS